MSAQSRGIVVSLFDFTGSAVRAWAAAGYECLCFDLQHTRDEVGAYRGEKVGAGSIHYIPWDSDTSDAARVVQRHVTVGRWFKSQPTLPVVMLYGFPPCTDLAGSGARHWAAKLAADPQCQRRAADRAILCERIANILGGVPYAIENPAGALSRLWRKHDHSFNPCDYGRYIAPPEAAHPIWPEYIAPRDAYKKRTLLWTGNGFVMPGKRAIEPVIVKVGDKQGSPQWAKLGGKSMRTKNIRSATPRGFARAAFLANAA